MQFDNLIDLLNNKYNKYKIALQTSVELPDLIVSPVGLADDKTAEYYHECTQTSEDYGLYGIRVAYIGSSFEQAIDVYSNLIQMYPKDKIGEINYKHAIQEATRLRNTPGVFKVFDVQHCFYIFVIDIDTVRMRMGHILDAGSEGVSEEDNILDW